jgi:AraC family transcriptional regulator
MSAVVKLEGAAHRPIPLQPNLSVLENNAVHSNDDGLVASLSALSRTFNTSSRHLEWCSGNDFAFTAKWTHSNWRGQIPPISAHLLYVVHAGVGSLLLQRSGIRRMARLRRGTIITLPPGTSVDIDLNGQVECTQLLIGESLLRTCAAIFEIDPHPAPIDRIESADHLLLQLCSMLDVTPKSSCDWHFVKQLSLLLCAHLMRKQHKAEQPNSEPLGLTSWQLRQVMEYMQAHLHQPIGLSDIARIACLTKFHFCTAFRQATGISPFEYLTSLRIDRAKELLIASSRSVSDISLAVGYGTPSSFTTRFHKLTGMTPRAFRMERRDES